MAAGRKHLRTAVLVVAAAAVFAIAKRDHPALLNAITPMLDDKSDAVRYEASAVVLRLSGGKTAE